MKIEIDIPKEMEKLMRRYVFINEIYLEKEKGNISTQLDLDMMSEAWQDVIDEMADDLQYIFDPLYEVIKRDINES